MSLSSYYVSVNRKDLAEKAIVAKREKEALRAQKCKEVNAYHQDLASKSTKYKDLEELHLLKTSRANEESRIKEKIEYERRERLEFRRQKLTHLLTLESDQYMKELSEMKNKEREKDPWNIAKLKEQIEDLQRRRKEGEQNMQRRYMHHLYHSNGPMNENNQEMQKEVSEAWNKRKEELEKLSLEKKAKEVERIKTFELEQVKATKEAKEVEMEQLDEQEKWTTFVEGKAEELKSAEKETQKLKAEKEILMRHSDNLLELQQSRDLVREVQKKGANKIQAMWQPREKLRRMSSEVIHSLNLDLKLLNTLSALNNATTADTALAILNLDEVKEAITKLEMQLALEKEREIEIQLLYHEEASRLWEKRKEEWAFESIARDEKIHKVFKILLEDITVKLERNMEEHKKYVQIKENCLKEINDANENAKVTQKTLEDKMAYFMDKAKRLGNEIEAYSSKIREPEPK